MKIHKVEKLTKFYKNKVFYKIDKEICDLCGDIDREVFTKPTWKECAYISKFQNKHGNVICLCQDCIKELSKIEF